MKPDMLDQLRRMNYYVNGVMSTLPDDAANEIERLRKALALAVGELSTHGQYTIYPPDQLMQQFIQEASRD
jgi:hypothetical protein